MAAGGVALKAKSNRIETESGCVGAPAQGTPHVRDLRREAGLADQSVLRRQRDEALRRHAASAPSCVAGAGRAVGVGRERTSPARPKTTPVRGTGSGMTFYRCDDLRCIAGPRPYRGAALWAKLARRYREDIRETGFFPHGGVLAAGPALAATQPDGPICVDPKRSYQALYLKDHDIIAKQTIGHDRRQLRLTTSCINLRAALSIALGVELQLHRAGRRRVHQHDRRRTAELPHHPCRALCAGGGASRLGLSTRRRPDRHRRPRARRESAARRRGRAEIFPST